MSKMFKIARISSAYECCGKCKNPAYDARVIKIEDKRNYVLEESLIEMNLSYHSLLIAFQEQFSIRPKDV